VQVQKIRLFSVRKEFDEWNSVTGAIAKGTSWEFEAQSIVDDGDNAIRDLYIVHDAQTQENEKLRTLVQEAFNLLWPRARGELWDDWVRKAKAAGFRFSTKPREAKS